MASRQSSSQGTYNPANNRNYSGNRYQEERSPKTSEKPLKHPNEFPITNIFMGDTTEPLKVCFCKYNPLHVIAVSARAAHEGNECPDKLWNPGQKIVKYKDMEE